MSSQCLEIIKAFQPEKFGALNMGMNSQRQKGSKTWIIQRKSISTYLIFDQLSVGILSLCNKFINMIAVFKWIEWIVVTWSPSATMTGNYITLIRRFVFRLWVPSGISKYSKASFNRKTTAQYCWSSVFSFVQISMTSIAKNHLKFERWMNVPGWPINWRHDWTDLRSWCAFVIFFTPLINQWTNQILACSRFLWACDFFHAITWVSAHEELCASWPKRMICRSQINEWKDCGSEIWNQGWFQTIKRINKGTFHPKENVPLNIH